MKNTKEIIAYYNNAVERTRLLQGASQVERMRNEELILRHLPAGPNKIADIGGGAGIYSFWLNELDMKYIFLILLQAMWTMLYPGMKRTIKNWHRSRWEMHVAFLLKIIFLILYY